MFHQVTWVGSVVSVQKPLVVSINSPRHSWPRLPHTQVTRDFVALQLLPLQEDGGGGREDGGGGREEGMGGREGGREGGMRGKGVLKTHDLVP